MLILKKKQYIFCQNDPNHPYFGRFDPSHGRSIPKKEGSCVLGIYSRPGSRCHHFKDGAGMKTETWGSGFKVLAAWWWMLRLKDVLNKIQMALFLDPSRMPATTCQSWFRYSSECVDTLGKFLTYSACKTKWSRCFLDKTKNPTCHYGGYYFWGATAFQGNVRIQKVGQRWG